MDDETENAGQPPGSQRRFRAGDAAVWEGRRCVVVRRRPISGLAMATSGTHELLLEAVDGDWSPGWVPEVECEPVGE